ncbi:MAG: hypothetical protein ACXVZ2_05555 [Gaiellaceae bacterium]
MPRWEPVRPEFVRALHLLAALDCPYAEAYRRLRPLARRLDVPRPSYKRVSRIMREERRRIAERDTALEETLSDILSGLAFRRRPR